MRVRLTDGTRRVDIHTHPDEQTPLDHIEATALRLLAALGPEPEPSSNPIGFVALDSTLERADPDDEYDTEDDET
ncbi:hypothetical protein [Streptomyces sp. NPDC051561]|uniref:hypothetical protein n=1 Tax=Streptomyces sp. NPDC051561 TaxID=3365658 RepID=UPI00379B8DC3